MGSKKSLRPADDKLAALGDDGPMMRLVQLLKGWPGKPRWPGIGSTHGADGVARLARHPQGNADPRHCGRRLHRGNGRVRLREPRAQATGDAAARRAGTWTRGE